MRVGPKALDALWAPLADSADDRSWIRNFMHAQGPSSVIYASYQVCHKPSVDVHCGRIQQLIGSFKVAIIEAINFLII